MKRKSLIITIIILFTLIIPIQAAAQSNYYFSVDKEVVQVYLNSDGTMSLDYTWHFVNQPNGHAIEYVDVGLPNGNASMGTVSADVNGQKVNVSTGDYQGNGDGFAVVMGSHSIASGKSGTVHVYIGKIDKVLYPDSQDNTYASGVFAPTYFDSQYVTGKTDLTVTFHLPPNVKPDEPRWHDAPSGFPSEPKRGFDAQGRITYTWQNSNASIANQYKFGASFPKSYVPADSITTAPLISISSDAIGGFFFACCFGFFFLVMPAIGIISDRKRKLQYLPPRISIEGHGIKRGLTAVEAAILMGESLDKVMTMILFGTVKKGAAQVVTREPLKVDVTAPLPEGLYDYELDFLKAFKEDNAKTRRDLLQEMTVKLVRSVSEKMKGFSRRETIDYYKSIMQKAWAQVEQANTPEVQSQLFDQNLEWTMLDKEYDDRTRRVFHGPIFIPTWWGRYDPAYRGSVPVSSGLPSTSVSLPSVPRLPGSDFASSVATGVQTFSQKVIGDVTDFTSRVTNVTNPVPKTTSSSSRGGSGCACACACAGCACACAGGGR